MRLKKDNNDFPFTEKSLDSYIRKVIVKEINDLKSQVIDDVSQNHHRNLKKPQSFLNRVHDLLKFWYEYGIKAIENTKTATLVEKNPKVNLSYGFVKPFLFEDFDFKSILLYVDGMFKHIDEAKKKYTQQDLQDFYLYTLKTAYKTDYNDIDSLLNAADIDTNIKIPDEEDTFNPNIIQDYELFKESDYIDLYKSIEAVIDFIGNDRLKVLFQLKKQVKESLLISHIIKSIFDYIIYSITLYIVRIYIVANFISQHAVETQNINESVITSNDSIDDFLKKMVIFKLDIENAYWYNESIFASTDDLVARDTDKSNFFELFKTFMQIHSIPYRDEKPDLAKFKAGYSKIFKDSQLFNFIVNTDFKTFNYSKPNVDELYLKLKYLLYTPNIGLQHIGHPVHTHRAVFFDRLIKTACVDKENIGILKKSVLFIYHFSNFMFNSYLPDASDWVNNLCLQCSQILPSEVTTYKKLYSEMNEFIAQFYDELSLIIFRILQYIENKIYYFENEAKRKGKIEDITSKPEDHYLRPIGVFDQIYLTTQDVFNENDESMNRAMLYPYYENISLYYDYIKSLPEFKDLNFFKEDGLDMDKVKQSLQKFVTWAKAQYEKAVNNCRMFLDNKKLHDAIKWVNDNRWKFSENNLKNDAKIKEFAKIRKNPPINFPDIIQAFGQNDPQKYLSDKSDLTKNGGILPLTLLNILNEKPDVVKAIYPSYIFYDLTDDNLNHLISLDANKIDEEIKKIKKDENLDKTKILEVLDTCVDNVSEATIEKIKGALDTTKNTIQNYIKQINETNISKDGAEDEVQQPKEDKEAQQNGAITGDKVEADTSKNNNEQVQTNSLRQKFFQNILNSMIIPTIYSFRAIYGSYYGFIKEVWNTCVKDDIKNTKK